MNTHIETVNAKNHVVHISITAHCIIIESIRV